MQTLLKILALLAIPLSLWSTAIAASPQQMVQLVLEKQGIITAHHRGPRWHTTGGRRNCQLQCGTNLKICKNRRGPKHHRRAALRRCSTSATVCKGKCLGDGHKSTVTRIRR